MNRQERRKLERNYEKSSVTKMYNDEAYNMGYNQGVKDVYKHILLITAYIARLHFDLGKKRLHTFMVRLTECLKSFATGQLSPSDIYEIEQECRQYGYDINEFK